MSNPKSQFSLRLDHSQDEKLSVFAKSESKSKTEVIVNALDLYFKTNAIREFEKIDGEFGNWGIYWSAIPESNFFSDVTIYCMDAPSVRISLQNISKELRNSTRQFLLDSIEFSCK